MTALVYVHVSFIKSTGIDRPLNYLHTTITDFSRPPSGDQRRFATDWFGRPESRRLAKADSDIRIYLCLAKPSVHARLYASSTLSYIVCTNAILSSSPFNTINDNLIKKNIFLCFSFFSTYLIYILSYDDEKVRRCTL